jgi:hypothetical protein
MKRWLGALYLAMFLAVSGFAADPQPQVANSDGKITVNVQGITLSQLLRLWDQATGMLSTVAPELANRTVSVRFSGLDTDDAIRAIFDTLGFDYVVVAANTIIVTDAQAGAAESPDRRQPLLVTTQVLEVPEPPVQPPPLIPTPFGPIENSRANPVIHLPPIPGETPPPPFFAPEPPMNVAPQDNLFRPIQIYQDPQPKR